MDPNPSVQRKSRKKLIIILIVAVLVVLILVAALLSNLGSQKKRTFKVAVTPITAKTSSQESIKQKLSEVQNPDAVRFMEAAESGDMESRYRNLLKAFTRLSQQYRQNPEPQIKDTMIELALFARAFNGYREEDWVIPN